MIEFAILKAFCQSKTNYQKYSKVINLKYLKENFIFLHKIYNVINLIYGKYDKSSITQEELEAYYISSYPVLKDQDRRELTNLLSRIFSTTVDESILASTLESHRMRSSAADIAAIAMAVDEGK